MKKQKQIMEGDSDAKYAYYCLHKLHKWPHEFMSLPSNEKAYVVAAIKIKEQEERGKELKKKGKGRKRGKRR